MNLAGVLAPVPTPFDQTGALDIMTFRAGLARWVAGPLAGVVVLGSTGEAALLGEDESDRVISEAREAVPRDRALVAGTGRESTAAAISAARRAAALGADALLVRTPSFFKAQMTADALADHYTAVADASPVPILLYNVTALTGVSLPFEAIVRLAGHPNVLGMKESGGDVARIAEIARSTPAPFKLLAGSAASFYPSLCVGACGGVLALACVLPGPCCRLYDLARAGRHEEARRLQLDLLPVARLLGSAYGVPGVKAALRLMGWDAGLPRPPLLPLAEHGVAALKVSLSRFQEALA